MQLWSKIRALFSCKAKGTIQQGNTGTNQGLLRKIAQLFSGSQEKQLVLQEIKKLLLQADVGLDTANKLMTSLQELSGDLDIASVTKVLKQQLRELLTPYCGQEHFLIEFNSQQGVIPVKPKILMFIGVNGAGKTTAIGKLAHFAQQSGKKVIMAACDTFRAGATKQLEYWAQLNHCPIIMATDKVKDPAALAFVAADRAKAEGLDLVLIDTAGRLQNKNTLMEELKKIAKVMERYPGGEIILVLDGNTGQNIRDQVKKFTELLPINGIVVNKFDGTAKGGTLISVMTENKLPILALGIGEGINDLENFNLDKYLQKVLGD